MITIQGLVKNYNGFCAVDHIDFSVHTGEIVALLGPNGAGKTTTLRILTGYLAPSGGSVEIKGLSLEKHIGDIKKIIGYLPESAPLYKNMLVYDYLMFLARVRLLDPSGIQSRIKEIVKTCGLAQIMHKPISELSKGLKQRVGLAHALLHDPEILILDEPSEGLDPNQIQEIREMIRAIGREKTVILSTHILSEAEATCDRMVIINKGKIVADGSPGQLRSDSSMQAGIHCILKHASLEAVREKFAAVPGIQGIEPGPEDPDGGLHLHISCLPGHDPREDLYQTIRQTEWSLLELHQQSQSLENIFKELTQEN